LQPGFQITKGYHISVEDRQTKGTTSNAGQTFGFSDKADFMTKLCSRSFDERGVNRVLLPFCWAGIVADLTCEV
jgi:hypothetical protein